VHFGVDDYGRNPERRIFFTFLISVLSFSLTGCDEPKFLLFPSSQSCFTGADPDKLYCMDSGMSSEITGKAMISESTIRSAARKRIIPAKTV
jgi:hypothetical protein